jgi:diacylglycerol diphosphate phosphatase/phosphatidate phosphatase
MFRLDDRAIQYPYTTVQRVSSGENTLISGGGPLLVLVLWAVIARPGVHKAHVTILGLFFSVYLTALITDVVKSAIGRPRPDLLARCQPEPGTPEHAWVGVGVCTQPDLRILLDGWRSFPSGHSSWAFSGLGYFSLFLAGQLRVFRPRTRTDLATILVFLAPLVGAALIATSRLADHRHDKYDVSCGGLLGLLVAYTTYRRDYRPLTHPECDTPYALTRTTKPRDRLEQGLAEDSEDIELLETFRVDDDDEAGGSGDVEPGYYADRVPKHDASIASSSRRALKGKGPASPNRRGRRHFPRRRVLSRLRRLVVRHLRESSLVKLALMLL